MKSFVTSRTSHSDDEQKTTLIPALPRENGWLSDDNYPLHHYQGFWYHDPFLRAILTIQDQRDFNPAPSDIIIGVNPKSGTNWLMALSFAIATRTRFVGRPEDNPLLLTVPVNLFPLIEIDVAKKYEPRHSNLPLFATHLPYTSLPNSVLATNCKIVYIWRDPKDAFISRWHYSHNRRPNKDVTVPIPLDEAFDLFCRGISPFGPYWDHVLGYWKAFLDRPDKILFLKYEDMMDNTELHVKRLAEHMDYPFSVEEEKEGMVARIVQMCSFESLSNLEVNKTKTLHLNGPPSVPNNAFF